MSSSSADPIAVPTATADSAETAPKTAGGMTPGLTLLMAVATGTAVANLYYNQPMLALISQDFGVGPARVALIPTATQLGYALGLLLLVPLGDRVDRRPIILGKLVALCAAMIIAALSPNLTTLVLASVAIGVTASIAQQILPFAAELASPATRGRTVGTVMSGLLLGILLARTVSGFVGEYAGWRAMFGLGAAITVGLGTVLAIWLPSSTPTTDASYRRLMGSLGTLLREEPALWRTTLVQSLLFAGFSAFWSVLALFLAGPPFGLGSTVAGLFGVVGAAGALAAPLSGRFADRYGPRPVIGFGIACVLVGFILFGVWPSLLGLALGVMLMDLGLQAAMISHQSIVYSIRPEARSRLNTIFVVGIFLGGAAGSALGSYAWEIAGWPAVVGVCGGAAILALALHLTGRRR
ncbi:MAG TPA: MFS transporter [Stellaceae bacterium]|nr:MFS transporter [Stellaceae bacterium]